MNQTPDIAGAAITPGERLKLAREQAALSIERVAKDLYLDVRLIQAIEANRFKELGAPVYAKGYLRKYARLVGVAEEEVLAQYQQSSDAVATPVPVPVAMGSVPEARQPLPRWILWVVIGLIAVAGLTTLLSLRSSDTETATQGTLISQPVVTPSITDVASAAAEAVVPSTSSAQSAAGTITVSFSFTGDSWVEVYDARNQQVLYELGTANNKRELIALPPLRVVLGAAPVVKLKVNSRDVEPPASGVHLGVARFVVKTDGSLE